MARKRKICENVPNDVNMKSVILVKGEVTGHAHRAVGVMVDFADGVLDIPQGAEVSHEEHKPITLPAGMMVIDKVREFDHFNEEARQVRD